MPNENNTNDLLIIYNYLINLRLYCHEIIFNIDNSIITLYKNIPYTLIKINYNNEGLISINKIIQYSVFIEAEKNGKIVNVSAELPKSFVVCQEQGVTRIYICQLLPGTLIKRASQMMGEAERKE